MQSTLTPSKRGRDDGDTPYSTTSKNQDSLSKRVFNLAIDNQDANQHMVSTPKGLALIPLHTTFASYLHEVCA